MAEFVAYRQQHRITGKPEVAPKSWQVRFLVQEVWRGDLDFEGIRMAWQ